MWLSYNLLSGVGQDVRPRQHRHDVKPPRSLFSRQINIKKKEKYKKMSANTHAVKPGLPAGMTLSRVCVMFCNKIMDVLNERVLLFVNSNFAQFISLTSHIHIVSPDVLSMG